jgi:hypothetical protein
MVDQTKEKGHGSDFSNIYWISKEFPQLLN